MTNEASTSCRLSGPTTSTRTPLYVSVAHSPRADTRAALEAGGEFGLTLCSAGQAALADFAGSFSTPDVDKSAGELISFGQPAGTATPWTQGVAVPALECDEWHVWLLPPDRTEIDLGTHPSPAYGDFLGDLPLPTSPDAQPGTRIRVERPGAQPGYATFGPLSHG
ncbi:hypothetical protein ACFZCY_18725 [Streptomyces sp. NPDC007983]|uniref:hypothetical protein n=1 Tax=Streptomyces sp. NPDC007983 TaxID=3364800 RepID=UPI0036EDA1C1